MDAVHVKREATVMIVALRGLRHKVGLVVSVALPPQCLRRRYRGHHLALFRAATKANAYSSGWLECGSLDWNRDSDHLGHSVWVGNLVDNTTNTTAIIGKGTKHPILANSEC